MLYSYGRLAAWFFGVARLLLCLPPTSRYLATAARPALPPQASVGQPVFLFFVVVCMARSTSFISPYQPLLRRLAIVAGVSLLLALLLISYTFGIQNHFFSRLFTAFFVFFWLLSLTFLGVVPFIRWAADSWFGHSWSGRAPATTRSRASTRTTAPRTPTRTAKRSEPKQHT